MRRETPSADQAIGHPSLAFAWMSVDYLGLTGTPGGNEWDNTMSDANEPSWKTDPRCDQEQLAMLLRCSEAEDMTEWNEWRQRNPKEVVWLQGADLRHAHLERGYLQWAHLEGANFAYAQVMGADLEGARLEGADFMGTRLKGSCLAGAHLEAAYLEHADFQWAILRRAHLEGAELLQTCLKGAQLDGAYLGGAILFVCHLEGARSDFAIVDGETFLQECIIDRKTDFTGVALGACRIESGLKQALEYNARRKHWKKWYAQQTEPPLPLPGAHLKMEGLLRPLRKLSTCAARFFMWASDYGVSTRRIIWTFFLLAVLFAAIYTIGGLCWESGMVTHLTEDDDGALPKWLVPWRALYFSVVTQTTLGFGDMFANARGIAGHGLLMVQVILGYILLGVLIYRVTNLFQAGGPAGGALAMVRKPIRLKKWLQLSTAAVVFAAASIGLFALERTFAKDFLDPDPQDVLIVTTQPTTNPVDTRDVADQLPPGEVDE